LARLGIRNLNPKLKNAAERLEHVRTPEGEPIPPNTQLLQARLLDLAYLFGNQPLAFQVAAQLVERSRPPRLDKI
jgi:transposase